LRVACVVVVVEREVQAVCCSLGLENEKYKGYEKSVRVCVCVCGGYGLRRLEMVLSVLTRL